MKKLFFALGLAASLSACSTVEKSPQTANIEGNTQQVTVTTDHMFEVHDHGRLYVFNDFELYKKFKKTGHTAYMKTYIGEGPKGETLVFGLTGKEKKMLSGWKHVDLFKGDRAAEKEFYGEMVLEGRLYVFNTYQDMIDTRKVGEAIFRYTDIGSGPKGETVVYVLNKGNKKKKPDALIAEFRKMNGLS